MKANGYNFRKMWNIIKHTKTSMMGLPERKEEDSSRKRYLKSNGCKLPKFDEIH